MIEIIRHRLNNLTDQEVRGTDKHVLQRAIFAMARYVELVSPDEVCSVTETYELQIAERYLKSPFFEKRVKGLNDLRDICLRVQAAVRGDKADQNN